MRFVIESVTKCRPRLGMLCEIDRKPNAVIKTPNILFYTQGGQVPYITNDVLKLISEKNHIFQLPVSFVHHFKDVLPQFEDTLSNFIGCKEHLTCITIQDPSTFIAQGHSAAMKVPVFTNMGKTWYNPELFMDLVESCRPDMYFILSDGDTNATSPEKRVHKSVLNTIHFNRQCLQRHHNSTVLKNTFSIAPIVGGYSVEARKRSIDAVLTDLQDVGGFLIDGLYNNGSETECIDSNDVTPIVESTIMSLPEEKIRCIQGCWNPATVLSLVEMGIDLFDTSYCYITTERRAALTFKIDTTDNAAPFEIDLRDTCYAEDSQPILIGCTCLTCRKYMRSYIHHLISVHELLGPILIMTHNMHHYLRFFQKIRTSIKDNAFHAFQLSISEQFRFHESSKKNDLEELKHDAKKGDL